MKDTNKYETLFALKTDKGHRNCYLIERNTGVKIRSPLSATCCTPAVHTDPSDLVIIIIIIIIIIIEEPEKAPDWLTTGITYFITKSGDSKEVRNYQPITCLTTMYKTLTRIIAKRISTQLEEQSLQPSEQKGCHPGSKGCKDQLMISKAIYEDCRRRNKNLV